MNNQQPKNAELPESLTLLPKTYFEELAEQGALVDFIENYMPGQFENDKSFREKIFSIVLQNNPNSDDAIAERIIIDIRNALSYFLERTKQWRNSNL